jgi:signal transduction histidine kinase
MLRDINFTVAAGEVIGVVGRRAAGKSTLFHILAGLEQATDGDIFVRGHRVQLKSPRDAHQYGIELVPQTPLLAEPLDVTQNIFLGREIGWSDQLGSPNWKKMTARAGEILAALDVPMTLLRERTRELSDEQRQVVTLARALCDTPQLLLLDDALSALSYQRQERMLALIRELSRAETSVMIISDDLKQLFAVTDRILVLYEGRLVADRRTADCTPREVVELIVGLSSREQITPIIWALENYHQAQRQTEELRREQDSLQQSLRVQDSLNRQLIERLQAQLHALDELNLALQATQRRLMTEREQERKHLARELHDAVIQDLLSFYYRLEEMESADVFSERRDDIVAVRNGLRQVVGDLRQMCSDLRPPTIDSHGLVSALSSLGHEWSEQTGVQLDMNVDPQLGRLPEAIELSIFRIVQEGLNNIRKHAMAKHAWLTVRRTPLASLQIQLTDDGRGMRDAPDLAELSARQHFGLLSISERVALLGGTMQIESAPGKGLALKIEIPSPSPSL